MKYKEKVEPYIGNAHDSHSLQGALYFLTGPENTIGVDKNIVKHQAGSINSAERDAKSF